MLAKIRGFFGWAKGRPLVAGLLLLFAILGLFVWHLGRLTTGLSPAEAAARASSRSWQAIWDNPINAPHKILQHLFQSLGYHGATSLRLVSVFYGLVFLVSFYVICRGWFGRLVGFLGVALLATTPLFIILARNAAPNIMLLSPLVLAATLMWLTRAKRNHTLVLILLSIGMAFSFYAPGGIWAVLAGGIICRSALLDAYRRAEPPMVALAILIPLVLIIPLLAQAARSWPLASSLLLVPQHWAGIAETLRSCGWTLGGLFWHARSPNQFIIGRVPALSAIQIVLSIFGFYAMFSQARREAIALAGLLVLTIIAGGLNSSYALITLALPIAALFVTAGLRYLYVEWRTIFPLNPLPRALAIGLMSLLVGFQFVYGIRYALVAWPRTEAVKHTYVLK